MFELVIEKLLSLAEKIPGLRKDRRDLEDNALRAISNALNETYLYYRDIQNGKKHDKIIEAQLSHYWAAAAVPMRHLDPDLSTLCEYKSEYWINPDNWNDTNIMELGIGLDEVRQKYRSLLAQN